jgi:DNA-binding CsgD family transcriptional regulator
VRAAVYESSPGGWRLTAHERSADALAVRGASAGARAHHVERSARQGNAAAVALLREAGRQAAGRAPGTAARWFQGALRLLADSAPVEDRVELLLARAQALAAVGQLHDSHGALEESLRLAPETSPALCARLTAACAGVERYLGHHAQANERLVSALEDVPAGSPEAVVLLLELAIDGFYRVAFDAMALWVERAVSAAERLGDPALTAAAHAMATLAGAWSGNVEQAEVARATAVRCVDQLTDAELATRLDAAANLAAAELYLDHFEEASRHAERVIAVGRATGQGQLFPAMHAVLCTSLLMHGRLAEAADLLDGALEAARLLDDDQGLAWTLFNRSFAALALGDVDGALDTAREAAERSAGIEPGLVTAWTGVALARALMESGNGESAIDVMLTSAGGETLCLIPGGWRVMCLENLVRARLDVGQVDAARRSAELGEAWAVHVGLPFARAMADRAWARIELAAGNPAAAAERALASVTEAESAGARVEAALARTVAGQALAACGERERAVKQLTRAADDLGRYGAGRYRQAADHELRRLGETVRRTRGPRAASTGPGSLSEREREIARLTVDRLTNRQIAGRLFLSEKTIETHMRNIFHKLGVSSRVEVARATERADSAGGGH